MPVPFPKIPVLFWFHGVLRILTVYLLALKVIQEVKNSEIGVLFASNRSPCWEKVPDPYAMRAEADIWGSETLGARKGGFMQLFQRHPRSSPPSSC